MTTVTLKQTDPAQADPKQLMMAVQTVAPLNIADHDMVIAWTRRSTDKNPIATHERYRGVIVNRATLAVPAEGTLSKFHKLLQSTIHNLADRKLQSMMQADGGMLLREVPASSLSLDAVLTYWAEERQSATLDNAKLTSWLEKSATLAALPEATRKVWIAKLPKIAAPGYQNLFTKEQAATIVAKILPADADSPEAEFIVTRCNAIIVKPELSELF